MPAIARVSIFCFAALTLIACDARPTDDGSDEQGATADELDQRQSLVPLGDDSNDFDPLDPEGLGKTSLYFEGTCDFLLKCSGPSRRAGHVLWGCKSAADYACRDNWRWVAAPSADRCGDVVTICRGGACITATVVDVSDRGVWEGSDAVLDSLDIPHGGVCANGHPSGGFGSARVTIQ